MRASSTPRRRTSALPGLAALVLAGGLLTGCSSGDGGSTASDRPSAAPSYRGLVPEVLAPRPEFQLVTTDGQPYAFAEETAGKPTFLYFGYTNCPDECPTAMADLAAALREVDPEVAEDVQVAFVTTDPERDSPEVLRAWVDRFSPEFVALTGTKAQIEAAQRASNVPVAYKEAPDAAGTAGASPGATPASPATPTAPAAPAAPAATPAGGADYSVAHANALIAYGTNDKVNVLYLAGSSPEDIAADLPALAGAR